MNITGIYTERMMDRACTIAYRVHKGQMYTEDTTYFHGHIKQVVNHCYDFYLDNNLSEQEMMATIICAYLHDVCEDTEITLDEIEQQFGVEIRQAIDALSRRKDESRSENIKRVRKNELALFVKRWDNLVNYTQCLRDGDWERAKMYAQLAVLLNS
jgi:(p)ppGpp synthase/HD superfamily hydrolase